MEIRNWKPLMGAARGFLGIFLFAAFGQNFSGDGFAQRSCKREWHLTNAVVHILAGGAFNGADIGVGFAGGFHVCPL